MFYFNPSRVVIRAAVIGNLVRQKIYVFNDIGVKSGYRPDVLFHLMSAGLG